MEEANFIKDESPIILLVGNKTDLESVVTTEEAEEKARSLGIDYIETSAKTSYQVEQAFMKIAQQLVQRRKDNKIPPIHRPPKAVLTGENPQNIKTCCH